MVYESAQLKNSVYDILVEECGISDTERQGFEIDPIIVGTAVLKDAIGLGAALRYQRGWPQMRTTRLARFYVTYHPSEDLTEDQDRIIQRTNARLMELMEARLMELMEKQGGL